MTSISSKQPSFTFCPPLPGKPNPNEVYDSSLGGIRSRVVQLAQKGDTCGYYALQILRNERKIGKFPIDSQIEERKKEKRVSDHRKNMTKIDDTLKFRIDFSKQVTQALGGTCSRKDAQKFLDKYASSISIEHREKCQIALQDFCNQTEFDAFSTFSENHYRQAKIDADTQFIKEFVDEEFIKTSVPKMFKKTWDQMSLSEKEAHVNNLTFLISFQMYGAKKSSWHPEQPIDSLIEQLKLHGPHLVRGTIGQFYYEDAPFELKEKREGKTIFGWKPNAKRINEDNSTIHAVVIIGADEKCVFFLDPLDGSDPQDPQTQKIYVTSYERLRKTIHDLSALRITTKEGVPIFVEDLKENNNYALHM